MRQVGNWISEVRRSPYYLHKGVDLASSFRIESHGLEYLQNKAIFVGLMGQNGIK